MLCTPSGDPSSSGLGSWEPTGQRGGAGSASVRASSALELPWLLIQYFSQVLIAVKNN